MFNIFTRYTVGDVTIERDTERHCELNNLLFNVSNSIKTFNKLVDYKPFKVLLVSHQEKPPELYHIDVDGCHIKY
jgi:hypothetical protein